jgi:hypothetical protein
VPRSRLRHPRKGEYEKKNAFQIEESLSQGSNCGPRKGKLKVVIMSRFENILQGFPADYIHL